MGLNGCRADNTKQTLLDFSFSLSEKQKIVAAKENEKKVLSLPVKDNDWEAEDVLLDASVWVLPI